MATIERALVHGVEEIEGLHHRTGGEDLDLQPPARHLIHLLGVVERELVEDVLRRPGALKPEGDGRLLRVRDHRCRHDRRCGTEEATPGHAGTGTPHGNLRLGECA